MKKIKPNYGQELIPFLWILSIIIAVLLCVIIYLAISGSSNLTLIIILALIALFSGVLVADSIWSSRIGKLIMRDKMIDELHLNGSENILDIGCGKGLLTIGMAKKLTTGKVIGMDHWQSTFEYNYTRLMAEKNVQCEGVSTNVEIVNGDAQKLPFEAATFDLITSSLVMHHVPDGIMAFSEMWRTLKPGGIIAIADMPESKIKKQMITAGFEIVLIKPLVRLFFMKVNLIIAKKNK